VTCRVYWGSHGCDRPRGHDGPHACDCCECEDHDRDHRERGCVAKPPYYGEATHFWGEDAQTFLEYALILALIAAALVACLLFLNGRL
jgi:hypothetical protein